MENKMIIINITQEDIDKGSKASCLNCPIALAIERVFEEDPFLQIQVGNPTIGLWRLDKDNFEPGEKLATIYMPKEATLFIAAFDSSERFVSPFSFTIDETPFLPWVKPVEQQTPTQL